MALTAKSMPYKSGFGPFAPEVYRAADVATRSATETSIGGAEAAARAITHDREADRRRQRRRDHHRADPGRGRLHRPGRRASCRRSPSGATDNGIVFIADEVQTGFARTGDMFAVRPRRRRARPDHDRQGHRRRPAARPPSPAAPRSWTPPTPAASAAPTAATRSPAPRRSQRSRRSRTTAHRACPRDRARCSKDRLRASAGPATRAIGDVRGRGAMLAVEFVEPGTDEPDAALTAAVAAACAPAGRHRPHLRHLRQRHPVPAAAEHQ